MMHNTCGAACSFPAVHLQAHEPYNTAEELLRPDNWRQVGHYSMATTATVSGHEVH